MAVDHQVVGISQLPPELFRKGRFSEVFFLDLPEKAERQEAIWRLCRAAGGEHAEALFEFVTTQDTATAICQRHFIASRTSLYRVVKKFYESWPDTL